MALVTPQELAAIAQGAKALLAGAGNAPGIAQTGAGLSALYQKVAPQAIGGSNQSLGQIYNENRAAQQQAYNQAVKTNPVLARLGKGTEDAALAGLAGYGVVGGLGLAGAGEGTMTAAREAPAVMRSAETVAKQIEKPTLYNTVPKNEEEWRQLAANTPIVGPTETGRVPSPWGNLSLEQRAALRAILQQEHGLPPAPSTTAFEPDTGTYTALQHDKMFNAAAGLEPTQPISTESQIQQLNDDFDALTAKIARARGAERQDLIDQRAETYNRLKDLIGPQKTKPNDWEALSADQKAMVQQRAREIGNIRRTSNVTKFPKK